MKILLITPIYHIEGRPDLFHDSSAIHYLVSPLAKDNDIKVVDTYCSSFRELFTRQGLRKAFSKQKKYSYDKNGVSVDLYEYQFLPKQIKFSKKQAKSVKKVFVDTINDFNPDVVVVHFPTYYQGVIEKGLFDCPTVCVLHKTDINRISVDKSYCSFINDSFDLIGSRSESIKKSASQHGIKVSDFIISSGIEEHSIDCNPRDKKPTQILYAGKLIERKNVDIIIKSFVELKKQKPDSQTRLKIVGSGNELEKLKKIAPPDVEFCKEMPRADVLKEMCNADVFVMPSVQETFGLVYLEAMSTGCITIGTKNEGIDGVIIDNKNGYLINPTIHELANLFNHIFSMSVNEINAISKAAIDTAKKYSIDNTSKYYLAFLKQSLRKA